VDQAVQALVLADVSALQADLKEIAAMAPVELGDAGVPVVTDDAVQRMAARDWSPLGAIESVQAVLDALSVERTDEAQPVSASVTPVETTVPGPTTTIVQRPLPRELVKGATGDDVKGNGTASVPSLYVMY